MRIDGVVLTADPKQAIWAIEVQAQKDDAIYHRLLIDMGLLGERSLEQPVRGLLLFLSPEHDHQTEPSLAQRHRPRPRPAVPHPPRLPH
nr:Rpn family recombination-promoting nuclease/putative transposase [Lamprobacter modestohalophilus]